MPAKKKMSNKTDKRHRAKIKVGDDNNGDPIYKWASGRTKKELDANKAELKKSYVNGISVVRRDVLFGTYAQEWYDVFKKMSVGESSRQNYASIFNKHLFPALAEKQLRAITSIDLQTLLNSKSYLRKPTVNKIMTTLRQIFTEATAQFILDRNPALSLKLPITKASLERRELTEAETKAMLHVGNTHPEGLLLLLFYYTGARRGEVLGLQWDDVDFKNNTITISRDIDFKVGGEEGSLKTAASYRTIPLVAELRAALWPIRAIGAVPVLPAPKTKTFISESTYERRWERLAAAMYQCDPTIDHEDQTSARQRLNKKISSGKLKESELKQILPQQSILTAHYFRHNFETILYDAGVDVLTAQKWMGHKDPKVTIGIYAHLRDLNEKRNVAKLATELTAAFSGQFK